MSRVSNVLYSCERCGYKTDKKSNIGNHYKRKRPCQQMTSSLQILQSPQSQNTAQNITNITNNTIVQYIITENLICSLEVMKILEPHVKHHKYGKEVLQGRLDDIRSEIEDGSDKYTFSSDKEDDLMMLTHKITKCYDHTTLTDAYYSFDPATKVYCMRCDEDSLTNAQKWLWQPCMEQDIFENIIANMKERVFDDYETMLSRKYKEDPQGLHEQVEGFYKIMKYFLIKPKCCIARHDNEILFYTCDPEYSDGYVGFELTETLNDLFTNAPIDTWQMMNIRNNILLILQTNARATWTTIKDRVIEIINLDHNILQTAKRENDQSMAALSD